MNTSNDSSTDNNIDNDNLGNIKNENKNNIKEQKTSEKSNKMNNTKTNDLIPYTILTSNIIQNNICDKPLLVLLDSGSNNSFIKYSSLPPNVCGKRCNKLKSQTIAGEFISNTKVTLQNICLPEFMSNRVFDTIEARVINSDCRYDMIIGRDALRLFKLNLLFKENLIEMEDVSLPMRPFPTYTNSFYSIAEVMYINILEQEIENEFTVIDDTVNEIKDLRKNNIDIDDSETDTKDAFISDIKPTHYEAMRPEEVLDSCLHLNDKQKEDLRKLINKYPQLFDGILRSYPTTVSLEVDPSKPPKAVRPYSIPITQLQLFKNELLKLLKLGVLERGS